MGTRTHQHWASQVIGRAREVPRADERGAPVDPSARARTALQESEERFRALTENSYDVIAEWDSQGRCLYASSNINEIFGYAREEVSSLSLLSLVHPGDRDRIGDELRPTAETLQGTLSPYRIRHPDGSWRWLETAVKVYTRADGEPRLVSTTRDITERKRVEEALRESEERLRQSQKMEAIGRLAAGVAHDFNNLLTAITGYCDLLLEQLDEEHAVRADAEEILRATKRAGALTRQLLAFSRRQALQTRILDLNALVADVDRMLRRLIGEDVELVTMLDGDLWSVYADRGQLEQVILNLVLNARDAMPRGGRLSLETRNVEIGQNCERPVEGLTRGEWVSLCVRDTGFGMDPETASRVFEPFFTTKSVGKGSGLGLSTVYGIVTQSGGHIHVDTEPGRGTALTIYLPRAQGRVERVDLAAERPALHGCETVLVVEDADVVRRLIRKILESHGYSVIDAQSGPEALRVAERDSDRIDLLLADVVLPRMDGAELARQVRRLRPDTRVLFMSGFSADALSRQEGATLVTKPFTPTDLLAKVRSALDDERSDRAARD